MLQNGLNLTPGKDHGDIFRLLRTRDIAHVTEVFLKNMPEQKQQGVEGLVLRRGGNMTFHCEIGEIFLYVRRGKARRRFMMQEALILPRPQCVGLQCFSGVMPRLNLSR